MLGGVGIAVSRLWNQVWRICGGDSMTHLYYISAPIDMTEAHTLGLNFWEEL